MAEKKVQEEKKAGFDVLFPEIRVEGYDVKPWTLRQGRTLMPAVSKLVQKIGKFYEERKGEGGNGARIESVLTAYPLHVIVGTILPEILDEADEIISVTLGIKEEEVQEMPMAKATALYLQILMQNQEYLLGFFGKGGGGNQSTP